MVGGANCAVHHSSGHFERPRPRGQPWHATLSLGVSPARLFCMHPFPHVYRVGATAEVAGSVQLTSPGLVTIPSAGPAEFDGPGDLWSPETLLTAALVDCFVLSFRAVARASRLEWLRLECAATGTLDRIENGTVYVHMQGSCSGCPSSTATLRMGIETRLREAFPELVEVVAV